MPRLAGAPGACGEEVDCAVVSDPGTGRGSVGSDTEAAGLDAPARAARPGGGRVQDDPLVDSSRVRWARLPAVRRAGAPAAPRGVDSAGGVPESACGRSAAWPSLGWPAYRSVGQSSGSTSLRKPRKVVGSGPDRVAGIRGGDQAPVAARSAEQRRGAPRPVVVAGGRYAGMRGKARPDKRSYLAAFGAPRCAPVTAPGDRQRRVRRTGPAPRSSCGQCFRGATLAQPSIGLGVTPARRCSAGARGRGTRAPAS